MIFFFQARVEKRHHKPRYFGDNGLTERGQPNLHVLSSKMLVRRGTVKGVAIPAGVVVSLWMAAAVPLSLGQGELLHSFFVNLPGTLYIY